MRSRRRVFTAVFVLAALSSLAPGSAVAAKRSYVAGGTIGTSSGKASVQVPEMYRILDVASSERRLLVCAQLILDSASGTPAYKSEVWQFEIDVVSGAVVGFEGRRVLMSIDSVGGIRNELFSYTVNCEDASAVYVEGYERGRTVVFSAEGHPLDINWRIPQASGRTAGFSFVHPVTWIRSQESPIDPVKYSLICIGENPGGESRTVLTYDLESGAVSANSLEEVRDELYPAMVHKLVWGN